MPIRETKRRIELAAAKYDIPVTEYCLSAIQQQLADDDLLEEEHITVPVSPTRRSRRQPHRRTARPAGGDPGLSSAAADR